MSHLTSVSDTGNGKMIIPEQVDNFKYVRESPTYRYVNTAPTGSSEIKIASAGVNTFIELTPNVFNLSRSFLEYKLNVPAQGAGTYTCIYKNKPNIQNLNIYTKSGVNIVQIDYLNKMLWMIGRAKMKLNDFMGRSEVSTVNPLRNPYPNIPVVGAAANPAAAAYAADVLRASLDVDGKEIKTANGPAGGHVGLVTSAYLTKLTSLNIGSLVKRPDGSLVEDRYLENQYFYVNTGANAATNDFPVRFPLSDVVESLLELDKDVYLKENLIMKITWEPQEFVGFSTTSLVDPTTAAAALAGGYDVKEVKLNLAVQTNPKVISSVMSAVDSGLTIDIPFATLLRNPVNSSAQNSNVKINSGMGRSLIRVYQSLFNVDETKNTVYDNSNLNPASANPLRLVNYYTQLNSQRLQDSNLKCTGANGDGDDYQWNLHYLKNSAVFNHNVYRANWLHIDDFTDMNNNSEYKQNQISNLGMPISNELTWYFYGTATGNLNLVHHTLVITRRTVTISPMGIQIV